MKRNDLKHLILDMDGVLWRGETPLPGLKRFFQLLQQLELDYILATNNATKVASQYTEKLAGFGVNVAAAKILTSAEATATHLRDRYPPGSSVYVVGEIGLQKAMRDQKFDLLEADGFVGGGARADLVVVGFNRHACYAELASAAYLVNKGAHFVGTNPDVTFPSEVGLLPGAGSLIAFIQAATGIAPEIVGKPGPAIFKEALQRLGGTATDTAMVGDRLETDIAGAQAAGLYTILLLSGVTTIGQLERSDIKPDLICTDIDALARYLADENDE